MLAALNGHAFLAYATNYLIDVDHAALKLGANAIDWLAGRATTRPTARGR